MEYWRRLYSRAGSETIGFIQKQSLPMRLAPAILVPVLLFLQFHMGAWQVVRETIIALIESYVIAFVGVYAWNLYRALPALMRESEQITIDRDNEIVQLNERLRQYERTPSPITVEIKKMNFSGPASIHINFKIHNNGPATTLHDWTLSSISEPNVETQVILPPQGGPILVKVGNGDVRHEQIDFQIHGKALAHIRRREMAWCLKFSDTSEKSYELTLPEALYPVS